MRLTAESTLNGASLSAWLDLARDLAVMNCSPRYLEGMEETLAQAGAACGGDLTGATRGQLSAYLVATLARTSAGTAEKRWRDLRRFYSWAADEAITDGNPMARVPKPQGERKTPRVMTEADLDALIGTCGSRSFADLRDRALLLLWCEIGSPRVTELAGLTAGQVDLRHDTVQIHGKGRRERWIAMGPATARAVSRYARARALRPGADEHPQFFLGTKGPMTRSGLGQMVRRRAAAAGIGHVHPHMFRHTASIRARRAGVPDTAIAALNGWESTRMLEIYGRAALADEALGMARAAQITRGLGAARPAR